MYLKNNTPKSDFITADGGFDVSHNHNIQEQLSFKLIYSEILTALHCQEIIGIFVCKIFDSHSAQEFLRSQKSRFENFNYLKPKSTRSVSKEFFVIGQGFKA